MNRVSWVFVGVFFGILLIFAFRDAIPPMPFGGEAVEVVEFNGEFQPLPCAMSYGDELSIRAGKAASPQEAVAIVRSNVQRLGGLYSKGVSGGSPYTYFVGWGPKVFVRHRGQKEMYQRQGWYVLATDSDGLVKGEFFLSDNGVLVPVTRHCTRIECCV